MEEILNLMLRGMGVMMIIIALTLWMKAQNYKPKPKYEFVGFMEMEEEYMADEDENEETMVWVGNCPGCGKRGVEFLDPGTIKVSAFGSGEVTIPTLLSLRHPCGNPLCEWSSILTKKKKKLSKQERYERKQRRNQNGN